MFKVYNFVGYDVKAGQDPALPDLRLNSLIYLIGDEGEISNRSILVHNVTLTD